MRGHRVIDPPFVPNQSCGDCRAPCIALCQSKGERRAEQRQAILRQTKNEDDPEVRQRVHADIEVYLENGRNVGAAEISIDGCPTASIGTIAACGIRTSIE